MSKDANSFGHDKALAWESRGFVYTKKRMHRFDTPSCAVRMWYGCHIRNCDTDESRSLAIALQEEVANRCMLLSPERVKVVNDTFKRQ